MMTTIDGKIVTDFDGNSDYAYAGEEYYRLIPVYGQAMGCGRATCQIDSPVDFSKYDAVKAEYEDKTAAVEPGAPIVVGFDRYGKLCFPKQEMEKEGFPKPTFIALTEQVPPAYLAYLDDLGIGYMFAGKEDFDPELFLIKLKEQYAVETFVLCGGAQINAVFMEKDLVDEISIVIGPAVDGTRQALTCVGTDDTSSFPKYYRLKEVRQIGNNGVVLHYEK